MSRSAIVRTDRRTTLKWLAAAVAFAPFGNRRTVAGDSSNRGGYGMSPDLGRTYTPGEIWPLTLTSAQHITAAALCDLIIPADSVSPSAGEVGVPDFIDEWISAPYGKTTYGDFPADRQLILQGLGWLEAQSIKRFGCSFAPAGERRQEQICDEICSLRSTTSDLQSVARFFVRFKELTAAGFYTTPEGAEDLKYVGNVALPSFNGPPVEVLRAVGLAP